jgi:hypothetical protein
VEEKQDNVLKKTLKDSLHGLLHFIPLAARITPSGIHTLMYSCSCLHVAPGLAAQHDHHLERLGMSKTEVPSQEGIKDKD